MFQMFQVGVGFGTDFYGNSQATVSSFVWATKCHGANRAKYSCYCTFSDQYNISTLTQSKVRLPLNSQLMLCLHNIIFGKFLHTVTYIATAHVSWPLDLYHNFKKNVCFGNQIKSCAPDTCEINLNPSFSASFIEQTLP